MPLYDVPASDVITTGWSQNGGSFFGSMNAGIIGGAPNDTTWCTSPPSPSTSQPLQVGLGGVAEPGINFGWVLRVRSYAEGLINPGIEGRLDVFLAADGVNIASRTLITDASASFVWVDYQIPLPVGVAQQINNVASAGTVVVGLQVPVDSGSTSFVQMRVSEVELEVPDAAAILQVASPCDVPAEVPQPVSGFSQPTKQRVGVLEVPVGCPIPDQIVPPVPPAAAPPFRMRRGAVRPLGMRRGKVLTHA